IVSGFFTSPKDQERIFSDEAKPIFIYWNLLTSINELSSLKFYQAQSSFSYIFSFSSSVLTQVNLIGCFILFGVSHFNLFIVLIENVDIKTKPLKFLHQYSEGFRHTRFRDIFSFDNRFIRLHASNCIVRFDCQDFLQGIRSTVCFKRPYLHLSETLSTELCFTTKRLLCNE